MDYTINYKNLLNTFVDESKAYSLDVKNRLHDLFLYHSMGAVEEIMFTRNFSSWNTRYHKKRTTSGGAKRSYN